MPKQISPLAIYDFTINGGTDIISRPEIITILRRLCNKWVFQLEKGKKKGVLHFQGRVSFKTKTRLTTLGKSNPLFKGCHWSYTSNNNTGSKSACKKFSYVMKEDTRIEGPWTDKDKVVFIPIQYRGYMERLRPFQRQIWESYRIFDSRTIDLIYDPPGVSGKSIIGSCCELYGKGVDLPTTDDAREIMNELFGECNQIERTPGPIFFDLPRAIPENKLRSIFYTMEIIKKGKLRDGRYTFKKWWINSPRIWIFCNKLNFDLDWLNKDRWKLWTINRKSWELVSLSYDRCKELMVLEEN